MLRWFVSKVVEYAVDELYSSVKFRKMISEELRFRSQPNVSVSVPEIPGSSGEMEGGKALAEAIGKAVFSGQTSPLSKDIAAGGKVVRSESARGTLDLLNHIGD